MAGSIRRQQAAAAVRPAALALVLGLLALAACERRPGAADVPSTTAAGRAQMRLAMVDVPDQVELPATLTTRDMAEVRARIPGVLVSLDVREGDRVRAGQTLGRVVDSRLGAEESARAAAALAAEAEAVRARAEFDRVRFLHKEGVYADARLEQASAAARAADASAVAARKAESAVAATAGQGALVSPSEGQVLHADVPPGSAVAPGMVIVTVTAGPPVLRIDAPETLGARLRPGARVILADAVPGAVPVTGEILRVYPAVEGGRIRADATVPGLDLARVGARATAIVELGTRQALVVPAAYVATRFGMRFATLATPKGTTDVPVEVRPLPDGRLEILSGLRPGDLVLAPEPRG